MTQLHETATLYADLHTAKAAEMWAAMSANEKALVRYGMFPCLKMRDAEELGFTGKDLGGCLMEIAKGGK